MGDPRFPRKKYERPSHPWEGERIKAENELLRKYGLKNKKELWRSQSLLRRFRGRARVLQALLRTKDPQAERERDELLRRLGRMGILPTEGATLDDVLALDVEAILSRRLQTLVYVKGLSNTPRQARQFVVHGHVSVGGRRVNIPGYLVRREEEEVVAYDARSAIASDLHPVRQGGPSPAAPAGDVAEGAAGGEPE